jgi:hypothetical protein
MEQSVAEAVMAYEKGEKVKAATNSELKKMADTEEKSQQDCLKRKHALEVQAAELEARRSVREKVERAGTVAAVQDGNVSAPERPVPGQAAQLQMVHVQTGKQCWICKVPMKVVSGKFGPFWTCTNYWVNGCKQKQRFHEDKPEEEDEAPRVPLAAPAVDFDKEPSPRASQAVKAKGPQAASVRGAANVRAVPAERVPPAVNEPIASLV